MVAIVTGATGGIGKAICAVLAGDGYDLILVGRNKKTLSAEVTRLRRLYPKQLFYWAIVHMEQPREIHHFFQRKDLPFAQLSILVNNAGISVGDDIFSLTEKDWDESFAVNVKAPFLFMQHTVHLMKDNRTHGSIINISSLTGLIGARKPNYASSKAGLIGLAQSVARSVGEFGIRVNTIAPGAVDTDLIADWDKKKRQSVIDQTLVKRIAAPEEIAEIVSFLASNKASYIIGAVINATGGSYLGI